MARPAADMKSVADNAKHREGGATRPFRRPPTAQQAVLDEIRRLMARGELTPGTQISDGTLANRFGLSRVPVREALKILVGEGLVTYRPHRGYFVADLSFDDVLEASRLREILEIEAIRVAIPKMTDDHLRRLASIQREVEVAAAARDVSAMAAADRRFHFVFIEASGMRRLVWICRILWEATDAYRAVYYSEPVNRRRVLEDHKQLVRAIQARDVERSIAVFTAHREHAIDGLRSLLEKTREVVQA